MSSSMKPILLHDDFHTPNPLKIRIVLAEMDLPYESKVYNLKTGDHKQEEYLNINPNGRLPAIQDPNTGAVVFESGAIIQYLAATYDKEGKLSHPSGNEKWAEYSWLHFQTSGQGPYFGQLAWFSFYHSEKLPSAIERYSNEVKRVLGVIERHLQQKAGKGENALALVGEKVTVVDLAFIPWNKFAVMAMGEGMDLEKDFPAVFKWHEGMMERPAVKKALATSEA